ncbi:MAG: helix-turn-helix domain-containing protein [Desulfomonile tiedjei]|nr:helix-turn-helix domain-containing protein [Desulfomonile tiedjei]
MFSGRTSRQRVNSGVSQLERLLGGLFIGDNVVWHDDAGSLASVFCLNFLQASESQNKPIIYVSFDRSPRNLLEKLGHLAEYPDLTVLDCFTWGKGAGSDVFLRFYREPNQPWPCRIVRVDEPRRVNQVMDALYGVHSTMTDDVRLVFESITGMQELWGGEDHVLQFYTHSCPRLYELNTVAYWILEKDAHSSRLRANINQIAQVAIELSIRRGTTSLNILKAENRSLDNLHRPYNYWTKDLTITFEDEKRTSGRIELGLRLKEIRTKRGLSQTELAKLVGVTPSTISQVESNLIYPSLPALLKVAEVLSVEVSSFFQARSETTKRLLFASSDAVEVKFPDVPEGTVVAKVLTPVDFDAKAEPYLLEIAPEAKLPSHFFVHKGEEVGYLLSGKLQMTVDKAVYKLRAGDLVYLTAEMPNSWVNPGPTVARLLWIKVK